MSDNMRFRLYLLGVVCLCLIAGGLIAKAAIFSIFNAPIFR